MSKRERILLAVMGALVVAALFYLLFSGGKPAAVDQNSEQTLKMATELTENLKKSMKSERDAQIISLAVKPWSNDPFLKMPLSAQNPGSGKAPERPNFIYSGFVVAGDKKMALINGVEYMVGEQLETGGYFVSEITPDYVMIEDANHRDKQKITYEDPSFFVRE